MNKELNMDAVIAWMYISETLDRCPMGASVDAEFTRLTLDLLNWYPNEFNTVMAVRDAHRLMGVKHD